MPVLVCYPKVPQSKLLRDLAGIRDDLEQIRGYLGVLDHQIAQTYRDYFVWEGMTAAIAAAYGRCFNNGVRERMPATPIDSAPAEVRATHEFLVDLRNKHVAHSVNEYEHNYLAVYLSYEHGAPVGVADVAIRTSRFIPLSDQDIFPVRRLIDWLWEFVNSEFEKEKSQIINALSLENLEQLSQHRSEPFIDVLDPKANSRKRSSH
ncbi:hypothetical protein [Polaromonas sp.]|uniref:hypothetical protein n=1 Tax=Polaromonas sp. TaxID=1869339 RepID=UPI0024881A49|nr:hypothetical protein [Polaromonas sp.]MDI1341288.1 hypothetical protein [Polaromonas sp.]